MKYTLHLPGSCAVWQLPALLLALTASKMWNVVQLDLLWGPSCFSPCATKMFPVFMVTKLPLESASLFMDTASCHSPHLNTNTSSQSAFIQICPDCNNGPCCWRGGLSKHRWKGGTLLLRTEVCSPEGQEPLAQTSSHLFLPAPLPSLKNVT